jgi:thioredoxin-like negative regulator of GroEL
LVILIGADWCPHCVTMKQSVIPSVRQRGLLDQVSFVQVDTDRQPQLARRLMNGTSVPQLVVYHKTPQGWQRIVRNGGQSVQAVETLLRDVLRKSDPAAVAAR